MPEKTVTHWDTEPEGFSIWNLSTCPECGKVFADKLNTYFGKRALKQYEHLPKLPELEDRCECHDE